MREPACHLAARATARESGWAARRKPQTGLTVRRPPGAAFFASEKQMANRLDKDRDDRAVLRGGDEIRLHASRTQALCGGPLHIALKPPAFKGRPRSAEHAQFHSFASTDPKPEFAPQSIAICPSGKSAGAVFRGHEFAPVFNACMPFWKPAQDQKSIFYPQDYSLPHANLMTCLAASTVASTFNGTMPLGVACPTFKLYTTGKSGLFISLIKRRLYSS